jgi:hypothetical protein
MSGPARAAADAGHGPLRAHEMWMVAPELARSVEIALTEHVAVGTRKGYESAIKSFTEFLTAFAGPPPFPVEPVWLCAYIIYTCMHVSVPSMKVYLQGIKYGHGCQGFQWSLDGDERIRRALRWVKRKYGMASKASKVPLSLRLLSKLFVHVPGWPRLHIMSHDDRVFVTASVIATLGFLRGGEFTWSKSSFRPLLRGDQLTISSSLGYSAVTIDVPQPKTRWWLPSVAVTCFTPAPGCFMDPVWLLTGMRCLSSVPLGLRDPAFRMSNGDALSRDFAVRRTSELMLAARCQLVDHRGEPLDVKAASWRAGGVASAKAAGLSDSTIMEMGRWTSSAWLNYTVRDLNEIRQATIAMWKAAQGRVPDDAVASGQVVGASAPVDPRDVVSASAASALFSSPRGQGPRGIGRGRGRGRGHVRGRGRPRG